MQVYLAISRYVFSILTTSWVLLQPNQTHLPVEEVLALPVAVPKQPDCTKQE